MNVLFTICGRAGSKGVKNKNIKSFLGYPLVFYTVSAIDLFVKKNPDIYFDIALNTDSVDLIQLVEKLTLKLAVDVIHRAPLLAADDTPKTAVINNCLSLMRQRKQVGYDMVVDLDITSPLRTVEDIKNLVDKKASARVDVVFSVTGARRNPYFNMVKKTAGGYERVISSNFNTRQEAPVLYDMNASLYAYSPSFLESEKTIFAGKCDVIKMFDTAVLDIDHENDFELMQVIARYLFEKYPAFREIYDHVAHIMKTGKQ
ncbi:cytidylyltransferase domain-containing protein [Anaeromusa acidaminophila]|uniref:acylneuraminate cytidylyltransferase family protein n=1 Tax=Anaeromusa acidaminophila TaxID=81464 RepID=UPI000363A717|nr:hypothetical protein [Anaeromusa acidaminophila]